MFNTNQYMKNITIAQDDETLIKALDIIELTEAICEDKWLARQDHFGSAGAMERQLEYLGGTLLPNAEDKLARMHTGGVFTESYTVDSWLGTTNEDAPYTGDDKAFDVLLDDQATFVDELKVRMRTAAILFATRVRAHDALSLDLNQFTYAQIKAKASANRKSRAA